jgi:hypothetical protein
VIPSLAVVRIHNPYSAVLSRGFGLWLPLFLLWIPVVLLSPLILVVLLVVCLALQISFWRVIAVFWGILCSLPGTNVHVRADGTQVQVRVI